MSFRRKNRQERAGDKKKIETESPSAQSQAERAPNESPARRKKPASTPRMHDGAIANDLIQRVMKAIDEWARANGLSSLPRHIVFEQALAILNAIDRNIQA